MSQAARLAGIFAIFAVLSLFTVKIGDPESPAIRALREHPEPLDLAIVGDSRAHTGVSPKEILKTWGNSHGLLGIRVRNFGVDGTDVLHHTSFVRNGLARMRETPRIIIWTPNPLQFSQGRVSNRLEQLHAVDVAWLAKAGAPFEALLDVGTMTIFPPWKHRPLVARMLSDYTERAGLRTLPLQKKLLGLTYTAEQKSRVYTALEDGQEPFDVLEWADRFDRGAKAYLNDYEKLALSDWHFEVARGLARKARDSGSQLVILEMPVSPWFRAHLSNTPKHLEWRTRLKRIAEEESALYFDHSAAFGASDHEFGDPGHMPRQTAERYSRFLAEKLYENKRVRVALAKARDGGS